MLVKGLKTSWIDLHINSFREVVQLEVGIIIVIVLFEMGILKIET